MAITRIPILPGDRAFRYKINLDGRGYIFAFAYRSRYAAWTLSVYRRDETPVRTGVRLVVNQPLWLNEIFDSRPSGAFVLIRTDDRESKDPDGPDFDEGRVTLQRITGDDIPAPPADDIPLTVEAAP